MRCDQLPQQRSAADVLPVSAETARDAITCLAQSESHSVPKSEKVTLRRIFDHVHPGQSQLELAQQHLPADALKDAPADDPK